MEKEYNAIDKFFSYREDDIIESLQRDSSKINNGIKGIKIEDIKATIEEIPQESKNLKTKIEEQIDNLVADYNIRLAYYNKKYYKQGFNDAIKLNLICK